YCHNFFLKKNYSEGLEEQNQLLRKLILQRKIYLFNLKKKNSLADAACHKIDSGCRKIDEKLSTIIPQIQDLEAQQQEFKQTVAETCLIQAETRETIGQIQAEIEGIRVYTSIPTQEELDNGKEQNPLLASMQTQCEILRSHIDFMNTINEKKSADLKAFNQAFQELQESYEELEILRQEIKQFQQDDEEFVKGVEELREDGKQLAQAVEELGEDNKRFAQAVEELGEDNKRFAQGVEKFGEDNERLAEETNKLTEGVQALKIDIKEIDQTHERLENRLQEIQETERLMKKITKLFNSSQVSDSQTSTTQTSLTGVNLHSQQTTKRKITFLGSIKNLIFHSSSRKNFSTSFLNQIRLIFAWIGIFQIANAI
uniref:hypothetical protein n=1 Tax=Candidatus Protochlamydia sp. R18 TaxID=1353977 RepID=UPI0005A7BFA4